MTLLLTRLLSLFSRAVVTVQTAVPQNFVSGDGTVVYMLTSLKIPYMILVSALALTYTLLSHAKYSTAQHRMCTIFCNC
jgi:hypothetical protein